MKQATILQTPAGPLPFFFGMAALAAFLEGENMKVSEVGNLATDMPLNTAFRLMWHGFKDGARKEGQPFTHTTDDMADWLDEDFALYEKCMNLFASSLPQVDEGNAPAPEKKNRRKISQ